MDDINRTRRMLAASANMVAACMGDKPTPMAEAFDFPCNDMGLPMNRKERRKHMSSKRDRKR